MLEPSEWFYASTLRESQVDENLRDENGRLEVDGVRLAVRDEKQG
jgi:hypothetical protein